MFTRHLVAFVCTAEQCSSSISAVLDKTHIYTISLKVILDHQTLFRKVNKEADVLPHALINHVETKLGKDGSILKEYVEWLRERILKWRANENYNPIFHIDVYGTIGIAFNNDVDKMTTYLMELEEVAKPFAIRIEGPVDTGDREGTMQALKAITAELEKRGSKLEIVADEWCNTLEDIKYFADNKAGHMLQIKTPDTCLLRYTTAMPCKIVLYHTMSS